MPQKKRVKVKLDDREVVCVPVKPKVEIPKKRNWKRVKRRGS